MLILQGLGLQFSIPPNLIKKNWAAMAIKAPGKEYSLIVLSYSRDYEEQ